MAIFKCKMCGGDLEIGSNETVAVCEYCNTKQTIPALDNEKKINLFNRANRLRFNNEFDKAAGVYESIAAEFPEEAEAYWGLCLCKYGIEYIDDPKTGNKVPTCHRTSFDEIFSDNNFGLALEYADFTATSVYREEAKEIDRLQKAILDIAKNEEPFDIFICYKETAEDGQRTKDSVLAQDMYDKLTEKGYKVFFSRITLEDKLGKEYEPYIFSALNSAKVMLAVGTKYEYYNAVWVKNEWSRFLDMMKSDKEKVLIPCYADIDAYDMPQEFKNLQGQDMGKIGFMQDLLRGIGKILGENAPQQTIIRETVVSSGSADTAPLLKRAFMFLEDGDFKSAEEYCEKVLDINPECAEAYLGKLMVELKLRKESDFELIKTGISGMDNYKKVMRFGDDALKTRLQEYNDRFLYNQGEKIFTTAESDKDYEKAIGYYQRNPDYKDSKQKIELCKEKALECRYVKACNKMNSSVTDEDFKNAKKLFLELSDYKDSEQKVKECEEKVLIYLHNCALNKMNSAITDNDFREAKKLFLELSDYKDSEQKAKECEEKAEILRKDGVYKKACEFMDSSDINELNNAINAFRSISGWKKSEELIKECRERIENIERIKEEEKRRIEQLRIERENRERKAKTIACILAIIAVVIIAVIILLTSVVIPSVKYNKALELMQNGNYGEAISLFGDVRGYKDSAKLIDASKQSIEYEYAISIIESDPSEAAERFKQLGRFKDSQDRYKEIIYNQAIDYMNSEKYEEAMQKFEEVGLGYKDSQEKYDEAKKKLKEYYQKSSRKSISAGEFHTVGLKSNGTVVATGDNDHGQCDVSDWTDIVAVSAGYEHTIGLKSDGTVVATGSSSEGKCDVSGWKDIVAISTSDSHTIGLKSDGTVVAVGKNHLGQCDVSGWTDVVAVSANFSHTVGLKSDGTVVATGWNDLGQCDVSDWTDIIAISTGVGHTVGLKSNGTVVATGYNDYGQCNVSDWTDIVAVSTYRHHTVGLKSNGTVVAIGNNEDRQCNVSSLKDIVAISAGVHHTVGLKSDGSVVAVGRNDYGECNVSGLKDIKVY